MAEKISTTTEAAFVIFTSFILLSQGVPLCRSTQCTDDDGSDPEQMGGGIEGDMILESDPDDGFRSAINMKGALWPNGIVPYTFSANSIFPEDRMANITTAFDNFHKHTCIRFVPRTDEASYINFKLGRGCSSAVGMTRSVSHRRYRGQSVILGTGCYVVGKIMHELMHALGFYHEQMRWDRDQYINIKEENIAQGKMGNFRLYTADRSRTDLNAPYDYGSIMHYPRVSFPADNGLETLIPKVPGVEIGQRVALSPVDIYKINKLYQCADKQDELPNTYFTTPAPSEPEKSIDATERVVEDGLFYCSFDLGYACGFRDDLRSNFDWKLTTKNTLTNNTGPTDDVKGYGGYMYTEATLRKDGDVAKLVSPMFQSAPEGACVRFYYHMFGR
ncbi:hatching enzyme 1.2-like, partial [Tubulanus polymorphus]|uniref:hatching enzyme 1.2-like n=1 Tax=Tubulanus polymorphus TaxID=672921 RepID=UPI003DA5091C